MAIAQNDLTLPLQTRFGTLDEGTEERCNRAGDVCLEYATTLLDGRRLWGHGTRVGLGFLQYFQWGDDKDIVLASSWSGGGKCCTSYLFITLSAEGIIASDTFGTHAGAPYDFSITSDAISFRMHRGYPANIDYLVGTFDGETISVQTVYEDDRTVAPAGAGPEVLRWVGQRPSALWEDGTERNRFRQIMSDHALNCLRTSTDGIASEFEESGGYVIASGMWPSQGGSRNGYIAIEVSTGAPFAAQMWGDELYIFAPQKQSLPNSLDEWIRQDVSRLRGMHRQLLGNRVNEPEYAEFCQ